MQKTYLILKESNDKRGGANLRGVVFSKSMVQIIDLYHILLPTIYCPNSDSDTRGVGV